MFLVTTIHPVGYGSEYRHTVMCEAHYDNLLARGAYRVLGSGEYSRAVEFPSFQGICALCDERCAPAVKRA